MVSATRHARRDRAQNAELTAGPVLAVDLDQSLCRTDTLHEALLRLAASRPMALLRLVPALREGKAAFKRRVAALHTVPAEDLPLNDDVVAYVERARAEGRRTALVSAADQRQVEAVAAHTGLFDEWHGSDGARNLSGAAKAAFLKERFGADGFEYIGDSRTDLPVWASADRAVTVNASPALRQEAEAANGDIEHLAAPAPVFRNALRAMRPHQWSKNLLIFLPILAAHQLDQVPLVVLAFVSFCLVASAVYVINDLVDLPSDRAHPRKRRRPFAAGELSARFGVGLGLALLAMAVLLAAATGSLAFLGALALYFLTTLAYSFFLKRKLIVDILALAGLYTSRVIAGGAVAGVVLSPWLLGFSLFLFLGLAAVKRQAELVDQKVTGRASSGRAYQVDDLPIVQGIALAAGTAAVLVLALYLSSDDVQMLYPSPWMLWLICPLLLYWLLRIIMVTHRGHMTDDPIVFAASDRTSVLVILICAAIVLAASTV